MLRFCGFDLELVVDDILARRDWPNICGAHDSTGSRWLIVHVDHDPNHLTWICAQVTERAIRELLTGHAEPTDVLRHNATGTVELVTVDHGRAIPDRCILCQNLTEHLFASAR